MFKGFGKKQEPDALFKSFVDHGLNGYEWLKDKVSNDSEASRLLAKCVVRLSNWNYPSSMEDMAQRKGVDGETVRFKMARIFAYHCYERMAVLLAERGIAYEKMTPKLVIEGLNASEDERLQTLLFG